MPECIHRVPQQSLRKVCAARLALCCPPIGINALMWSIGETETTWEKRCIGRLRNNSENGRQKRERPGEARTQNHDLRRSGGDSSGARRRSGHAQRAGAGGEKARVTSEKTQTRQSCQYWQTQVNNVPSVVFIWSFFHMMRGGNVPVDREDKVTY